MYFFVRTFFCLGEQHHAFVIYRYVVDRDRVLQHARNGSELEIAGRVVFVEKAVDRSELAKRKSSTAATAPPPHTAHKKPSVVEEIYRVFVSQLPSTAAYGTTPTR